MSLSPISEALAPYEFRRSRDDELETIVRKRERIFLREYGKKGSDEFDQYATHLVAVDRADRIVGAFRILHSRQALAEVERFIDLSSIVSARRRVGYIGSFWVSSPRSLVSTRLYLMLGLLKLSFLFATANQLTDFITFTYRSLVSFYRGAFFRDTGIKLDHPSWGRISILHADIERVLAQAALSNRERARFLSDSTDRNFHV